MSQREWWIDTFLDKPAIYSSRKESIVHVREVNAEHDAWVERLIEFADTFERYLRAVETGEDERGIWYHVVAAWHRSKSR
jgi:hypothetical protein